MQLCLLVNSYVERLSKRVENLEPKVSLPEDMTHEELIDDARVRARCLFRIGQWAESLDVLIAAVKKYGGSADLLGDLAETYSQAGRFEEALNSYDKAITLDPRDDWRFSRFSLQCARDRSVNKEDAKELLKLFLGEGRERKRLHVEWVVSFWSNDMAKMEDLLRQAQDIMPRQTRWNWDMNYATCLEPSVQGHHFAKLVKKYEKDLDDDGQFLGVFLAQSAEEDHKIRAAHIFLRRADPKAFHHCYFLGSRLRDKALAIRCLQYSVQGYKSLERNGTLGDHRQYLASCLCELGMRTTKETLLEALEQFWKLELQHFLSRPPNFKLLLLTVLELREECRLGKKWLEYALEAVWQYGWKTGNIDLLRQLEIASESFMHDKLEETLQTLALAIRRLADSPQKLVLLRDAPIPTNDVCDKNTFRPKQRMRSKMRR